MRATMYVGVSTALAGVVVAYAFGQRPNFYSACVYLSQSNLSLMILINLCFLCAFGLVWTLSRILYGRLRPIEAEQLYERGWFAVTETALAMTIFRDELGSWFVAMFVALMAGRVWGWIGRGRVEVLEQQPPANPRLFHARLIVSLALSLIYDLSFVSYAANIVYDTARPNMMVMFLFEFVLLTTSSVSTALRYIISTIDSNIQQKQTQELLAIRRAEVQEQRGEMIMERQAAAESGEGAGDANTQEPLPDPDDIEEMDIEPPGWEAKGQWILCLDIITDFVRLVVYIFFFVMLATFFGLPIHIMRDLFMTARSFIKRLSAFLKYRTATRDMNQKYPDATGEEIRREDTCIICREEMRPWNTGADARGPPRRGTLPVSERTRPKKLPCGHVLHLGCLRSWLERQQFCPTCRRPVVDRAQPTPGPPPPAPGAAPRPPHPAPTAPVVFHQPPARQINLGPLRFAYGRRVIPPHPALVGGRLPPNARTLGAELGFGFPPPAAAGGAPGGGGAPDTLDIGGTIHTIERRIMEEAERLELNRQELALLKQMQDELSRLRAAEIARRTEVSETIAAGSSTTGSASGSSEATHSSNAGAVVAPNPNATAASASAGANRSNAIDVEDGAVPRSSIAGDTEAPPNWEAARIAATNTSIPSSREVDTSHHREGTRYAPPTNTNPGEGSDDSNQPTTWPRQ